MHKRITKLEVKPFLFLAVVVLFFWQLGRGSLVGDEAIYAAVAQSIVHSGSWVTLHLNGAPWYEKPPLAIWMTAIFFKVFGVTAFAARLEAALGAIGSVVMVYLIGRRVFDRSAGLLAAGILALTAPILFTARFGNLDALLCFWIYLALYGALRALHRPRWWLVAGIACGGAIMTKGAAGLFAPLIILGVCLAAPPKLGRTALKNIAGGVLLALVVVLPWHLAELIAHGESFLGSYIGYHVLDRTTRPLEGHTGGLFFYLGVLIKTYEPWILLVVPALVYLLRSRRLSRLQRAVTLVPIGLVTIITAIMKTKQDWYFLPAYPALALLLAVFILAVVRRYPKSLNVIIVVIITMILCVLAIGPVRRHVAQFLSDTYARPTTPQATIASLASHDGVAQSEPLHVTVQALDQPGNPSDMVFYSGRRVIVSKVDPRLVGRGDLVATTAQASRLMAAGMSVVGRSGNLVLLKY
jgi:4-amino-4-deoxy-L-arabinose transferase-like glycosyltransferase